MKLRHDTDGAEMGLLAPSFLARLRRLELLSRRLTSGNERGLRATRRRGRGSEVVDNRAYESGDDPRRIDWRAYARFERLLVNVEAQDAPLRLGLLLDASRSMAFGAPTKLRAAQRIAAGLAAVAVGHEDRFAAVAARARPRMLIRAGGGWPGVQRLLRSLGHVKPSGATDLAAAASAVGASLALGRNRPGKALVVVLSDLLDPRGALAGARALRERDHEVVLVELLSPFEASPPDLDGLEIEDAETGARIELPPGAREAYLAHLQARRGEIEDRAAEEGIRFLSARSDEPFEDVVLRAYRQGVVGGRIGSLGRDDEPEVAA